MPGVHFEYTEEDPSNVKPGSWVLFLPMGLAEAVYENPPIVQVEKIRLEGGEWVVQTTLGVMMRKQGELLQVIV